MPSGFMDNEECFGFHSEYYIDSEWRVGGYRADSNGIFHTEKDALSGYMEFSGYKGLIYFLADNGKVIIQCNPKDKTASSIRTNIKEDCKYIAVNRQGYFLYNEQTVILTGFDGKVIYSYKYGKKNNNGCICIYDSKVYYSVTKKMEISSVIQYVDMVTRETGSVWCTEKGDSVFDKAFNNAFVKEWGMELPFSGKPSNIGNLSCGFLYANCKRIIAGYIRGNYAKKISYIINVDLEKKSWDILDCFAQFDKLPNVPKKSDRHIFAFSMLNDMMWVKTDGDDIRLIRANIQNVSQLYGKYPIEQKLAPIEKEVSSYYFFDGKVAYIPEKFNLLSVSNGERSKISFHYYETTEFWKFDDSYIIPNEYGSVNIAGKYKYELLRNNLEELINNAKTSQIETVLHKRQDLSVKISEDMKQLMRTSGSVEEFLEKMDEIAIQKIINNINKRKYDNKITLAGFRQNAPQATGFRDALLAYRKSLANSWDYNAYVGILLGVSGPRHGDAACMNYAIGQGDNGNHTKKTLEERGLMPIFEKYKGKKIDLSIILSDVEDEIVSVVPEYAQIRQEFHEKIGK